MEFRSIVLAGRGIAGGFTRGILRRSLILVYVIVISYCGSGFAETYAGNVVEVLSGDTITLDRGKEQVKVRLDDVVCPALTEPFGEEAKRFTESKCLNKNVTVEVRSRTGNDVAGIVRLSERSTLSVMLAKEGLARIQESGKQRNRDAALAKAFLSAVTLEKGIHKKGVPLQAPSPPPAASRVAGAPPETKSPGPASPAAGAPPEAKSLGQASPARPDARAGEAAMHPTEPVLPNTESAPSLMEPPSIPAPETADHTGDTEDKMEVLAQFRVNGNIVRDFGLIFALGMLVFVVIYVVEKQAA